MMLQSTTTREIWERYRELERKAKRICRQKNKRIPKLVSIGSLEKLRGSDNSKKFH